MSDNEETFNDSDVEGDELLQDWSLATKIIGDNKNVIPLRGEKDYEPDGTGMQGSMLFKAKKVMFDVLRQPDRGTIIKNQVKAYYDLDLHVATIKFPKGTFTNSVGSPNSDGTLTLQFHEFVYLVERGSVSPIIDLGINGEKEEYLLSLQDVYSFFKSQDELDEFFVYAYLKRMGYIVFPTNWKYGKQLSVYSRYNKGENRFQNTYLLLNGIFNLFTNISYSWLKDWATNINNIISFHPVKFASSGAIFESINKTITFYAPPKSQKQLLESHGVDLNAPVSSNYKIAFDVWKPNPSFKKSNRYLPDFQIVIHNKNSKKAEFPNLKDFKGIFQRLDHKFPFINDVDIAEEKVTKSNKTGNVDAQRHLKSRRKNNKGDKTLSLYARKMKRIKEGYRSFLLAVMDGGLVSIVKITETDFGSENIWYVPSPKIVQWKKPNQKKRN